jgi:hypothetical protein
LLINSSDRHLDDDLWDHETNRPKFANFCIKMLEQEWRSWEAVLAEVHLIVLQRPPESATTPWGRDSQLINGDAFLEGVFADAAERFQRFMLAARDYAETLLVLLKHERLMVQPAWSAARGMMEAVLLSCWLLDSTKTPEMRLARAISLLPSVLQGSIDTLQKFPDHDAELASKRRTQNDLVAYLKKNRVEVVWKHDKRQQRTDTMTAVVFKGNKEAFNHNITQLAESHLPDDPWLYSLLSGAAHSEAWLLAGTAANSAGEALNGVVMPLLPISSGYLRAVCTYFGIDARPHIAANERRLKALVIRGGTPVKKKPDRATVFGTLGSGFAEEFLAERP